jgi:peptidyl-tRNA hydrolase
MKMYILIRESVPLGKAVVAAAHASLACYLRFKEHPDVAVWLSGPFFKTVCRVGDAEFEHAKQTEDHVVVTESSLDNDEVALAFRPREEYPKQFKFLRLFK